MTQITNPKILTLCIATFNRSERVTQLINEILNFDIDDLIEILVIDDGSSRNFVNPLRAVKYFYKFILFKIQVIFFKR